MAELSLAELCSRGQVNGQHTIEDGFAFQSKTYDREDAELIERAGFARAQVFASTPLAGSVDQGGEDAAPQIATPKMGLKPGMQYTVYAEEYTSEWQGELDGWLSNSCIFAPKAIKRVIETERTLCVKKVHQATDLCYKELLETRLQDRLLAGSKGEDDTDFLNQVVLDTFIETNHINIDRHAFQGDYGAADNAISKVDGWVKQLVQATGTSQGQIIDYVFTGDLTGLTIMGQVGGDTFFVPFDTDADTTIINLVAQLNTYYERRKGRKLFKTVAVGGTSRTVRVTAWEGYSIVLDMVIGTGADGFYRCPSEHILKANTPPSDPSAIYMTATEIQAAVAALSPISVDLVSVRADNVMQLFDDFYDAINNTDSSMLQPNFGGNMLVARNVYNSYIRAVHNQERSKHIAGNQGGSNLAVYEYMGLRLVPINYMQNNMYMLARPQDLLVGVDLVNDVETFETHRVPMTSKIQFHGATTIGFQVRRVDKIAGTFSDPTDSILVYEAAMPCNIVRTRTVLPPS